MDKLPYKIGEEIEVSINDGWYGTTGTFLQMIEGYVVVLEKNDTMSSLMYGCKCHVCAYPFHRRIKK